MHQIWSVMSLCCLSLRFDHFAPALSKKIMKCWINFGGARLLGTRATSTRSLSTSSSERTTEALISSRALRITISTSSMSLTCCNRFLMRIQRWRPTSKRRSSRSFKTRQSLIRMMRLKIGPLSTPSGSRTGIRKSGTQEQRQAPMHRIPRQFGRSKKWLITSRSTQTFRHARSLPYTTCLPKTLKTRQRRIKSSARSIRLSQKWRTYGNWCFWRNKAGILVPLRLTPSWMAVSSFFGASWTRGISC